MQEMFITPMTPIVPIKTLGELGAMHGQPEASPRGAGDLPFKEIFSSAIRNMAETETVSNNDTALLAFGDIDDLHTIGIDATKAYLAERLVVELRNRVMDAYSEIMRINV